MMVVFRNEPIEVESIDGSNAEDAFITSAYWTKTGVDLSEDELIDLTHERPDIIAEMLMEKAVEKAEARFDLMMDR